VGIASLGAARVLARRPGGYTLLFVGLFGGSLVRPHIAILGFIAFALAFLFGRREPSARGGATPAAVAKVAGLVVLLAVGALVADRFSEFLDANDISSVESGVTVNADRTGQGGSEYTAANPQNPLGYVEAGVTILFRPFPFEVSGTEQVVTSAEALFLLGLAIASWRRLVSIPFRLRREPYVAYAGFLVLMLVFVLGTIGNFGILARQRTQVIPFVFVLLSVTVVKAATSKPARSSPSLPARRPR
jgi:hypothetical protein